MRNTPLLIGLLTTLALSGCSVSVEDRDEETVPPPAAPPPAPQPPATPPAPTPPPPAPPAPPAPPVVPATLEECFGRGGQLVEVDRVFNNDSEDHGALVAFALSPERQLAAAGADGTVKVWTLEGLVGTIASSVLTYGPEVDAAPAVDLAFHGGRIVVADTRGLVTSWSVAGDMEVLGGTDPTVAMAAVAFDPTHTWMAQADARPTGTVMLRRVDGTPAIVGPLETSVESVSDLAFLPSGALVIAGRDASGAIIETRDAADPRSIGARYASAAWPSMGEVAVAGETVAAVVGGDVVVLDAAMNERHATSIRAEGDLRSIALTELGRFAVTADARGVVYVLDTERGAILSRLDTRDGAVASIRIDSPTGLVFAASSSAHIRALACTE